MPSRILHSRLVLAVLISSTFAHGTVQGIVAGGVWYSGYSPSFQWKNPIPVVAGWSIPEDLDNGFAKQYTNASNIVCHRGATPGGAYVKVAAGSTVELQWTPWPNSHLGPIMDYLSPCNGDCANFDKASALWTKIDEVGLLSPLPAWRGTWAVDTFMQNGDSWTVTIPSSIAPGKYVLRHEIIALHEGQNLGGAQNYPQCINLEISGSGTDDLSGKGTLGTKLYTQDDPGIHFNIYGAYTSYPIPGPRPMAGSSNSQPSSMSGSVASTAASVASSAASVAPTFTTSVVRGTSVAQPTTTKAQAASSGGTSRPTGSVLFSGTLAGAKPTRFTCYADEL